MRGRRVHVGAEAGQATAEWIGLVLAVALALGGLGALLPAGGDAQVGDALAARISGAAPAALREARPARSAQRASTRATRVAAFRTLRRAGRVIVRRAWIVCLGYRRFRYELKHPRLPNQAMPLDEAIDIANGCLNPYAFVGAE